MTSSLLTPELKAAYMSIRRRLPTLQAKHALLLARDSVETAARIAATPKRKRARVATLRSQIRWEAGPGNGGRRGRE